MAEDKQRNEKEFSFVKEKIKHQPVYNNKMFRKALFSVGLSVVCGLVACFVFVMAHPWMKETFGKEETTEITIPKEEEPPQENVQPEEPVEEEPPTVTEQIIIEQPQELEVEDYAALYKKFGKIVEEAERGLVTVTAANSDVDWFNEIYESQQQISGLIIGDNGVELLVLTSYSEIEAADRLQVTFAENSTMEAALKNYDRVSDLAVISVNLAQMQEATLNYVKTIELGSSRTMYSGEPVIAIGSPAGVPGSVIYGNLTVANYPTEVIDGEYNLLITDIQKSSGSSGILLSLDGKVAGIIEDKYRHSGNGNVLTAYGISDMKHVIEHLSNSKDLVYLGVTGANVSAAVAEEQEIPVGVYVTGVELNSPAMNAGVQPGDVITEVSGQLIYQMSDLQTILLKFSREQVIQVTVMRQGKEGYQELICEAALQQLK